MKKNKMMRLASVLLVVVLLSSSIIGGTFAKYVTVDSGSDGARVAKWGVSVNIEDQLGAFHTEYSSTDGQTVLSANTNINVVAPGTSGHMTFTVTGDPEVAAKVLLSAEMGDIIDLPDGTYKLPAGEFAADETTVTTTGVYEPIKFYFGTTAPDALQASDYSMTLAEVVAAIEGSDTALILPGNGNDDKINLTYTFAWIWALDNTNPGGDFDGSVPYTGASVVDFLDTYLGNQDTPQSEGLTITVRIEQVD